MPLTGLDAAASSMHGMIIAASEAGLSAAQTFMRLLQGPVNNIVLEASKPESRAMFDSQDWLSLLTVQARFFHMMLQFIRTGLIQTRCVGAIVSTLL